MGIKRTEEFAAQENGKDIFRNKYGDYVKLEGTEEKEEGSILDEMDLDADTESMFKTLEEEWKKMEARVKVLEKENTVLNKKLSNREKELEAFAENNITVKKFKTMLTYMDSDNVNFDVSILKNADYIFFNTLHCSHTLYFKVKDNLNAGRDKQEGKDKLIYINNNNVDVFTDILMEKILGENE